MVNGMPLVIVRFEGEALLVIRGVRKECTPGVGVLLHFEPKSFPDTSRWTTNEDTRRDLHQPTREKAAKPRRTAGEHDDGHQGTS